MQVATELGTPGTTRFCGIKGSSVSVTRPALSRPETGSWHHRRFVGPARGAFSRCRRGEEEGREEEEERKGRNKVDGEQPMASILAGIMREGLLHDAGVTKVDGQQPIASTPVGSTEIRFYMTQV